MGITNQIIGNCEFMKEIEMYPGANIGYAYGRPEKYRQKTGEDCFCKFNDKELYPSETLDEMYLKVTGKTKAESGKGLQDEHNGYLRREAESKAKIPQLIKGYMAKARGIIPDKHLEYWDKIVPVRLDGLHKGFGPDCRLKPISGPNTDKPKEERFKNRLQMSIGQGHSGMSASLVSGGLCRFHDLGPQPVDYIRKH